MGRLEQSMSQYARNRKRCLGFAIRVSAVLLFAALVTTPAAAQMDGGVRTGVSVNPDQFYIGVHLETEPLIDRLSFRPNLEVGLGDNRTLVAINPEFIYRFRTGPRPWGIYAGGGPAINVIRFNGRRTETEAGLNALFGLEHRDGLFFEFKVGGFDSPELKFGVGYTWR
jgi:hypothetical protein